MRVLFNEAYAYMDTSCTYAYPLLREMINGSESEREDTRSSTSASTSERMDDNGRKEKTNGQTDGDLHQLLSDCDSVQETRIVNILPINVLSQDKKTNLGSRSSKSWNYRLHSRQQS